jgi:hypothetical protein
MLASEQYPHKEKCVLLHNLLERLTEAQLFTCRKKQNVSFVTLMAIPV